MNELALFAGAGGGILGSHLLDWTTVCAVENDPYAASVLLARQNDGILPPFPIWDDVRTFDGKPWRGIVDVVSGGFPCQDISCAGKGEGITGERSGLWKQMARIIGEVRPRFAFIENSPMLIIRGLEAVLCDLAALGYDARWGNIGADACGFPHHRARLWMVAYPKKKHVQPWNMLEKGAFKKQGKPGRFACTKISKDWREAYQGPERVSIFRDPADGMAAEMGELAALGNGQVPAVVRLAWETLSGEYQ